MMDQNNMVKVEGLFFTHSGLNSIGSKKGRMEDLKKITESII